MDRCSYFIENKALFGSYPDGENTELLENLGVKYFIDLTYCNEKNIQNYEVSYNSVKINYPILDKKTPLNTVTFSAFILRVCDILKNLGENEKVYVHCKGGHGRSGVVVACLLCLYYKISPEEALEITRECHQQRKVMREKWRLLGSPQTIQQKQFVIDLFYPLYFYHSSYLSNYYNCEIFVENLGVFSCVEAAYQAHKNLNDKTHIELLKKAGNNIEEIKKLGKKVELRSDWDKVKVNIMYQLIKSKFDQNILLKNRLILTNLRPIVKYSRRKSFWSNMDFNMTGKLLQKVRNEYIKSY